MHVNPGRHTHSHLHIYNPKSQSRNALLGIVTFESKLKETKIKIKQTLTDRKSKDGRTEQTDKKDTEQRYDRRVRGWPYFLAGRWSDVRAIRGGTAIRIRSGFSFRRICDASSTSSPPPTGWPAPGARICGLNQPIVMKFSIISNVLSCLLLLLSLF